MNGKNRGAGCILHGQAVRLQAANSVLAQPAKTLTLLLWRRLGKYVK